MIKQVDYAKLIPVNMILRGDLKQDSASTSFTGSVLFYSLDTLMAKACSPLEVSQEFETARRTLLEDITLKLVRRHKVSDIACGRTILNHSKISNISKSILKLYGSQ